MDNHRDEFPVTRMCKVLHVSRSGYYAWRTRPVSAREMANRELANKIEAVYNESDGTYGSPRIHSELNVSMNGAGTWYDNAPMESFFGTLKSERVHHLVYSAHQEARTDLFQYIEGIYNPRRRHSSLDYLSPADYEKLYYQRHGFA